MLIFALMVALLAPITLGLACTWVHNDAKQRGIRSGIWIAAMIVFTPVLGYLLYKQFGRRGMSRRQQVPTGRLADNRFVASAMSVAFGLLILSSTGLAVLWSA